MHYDIIGIGNALVDIQVMVDEAFIKSLGITKGAMTLFNQEEQNYILKQLSGYPKKMASGGSAANTIHGVGLLGKKTYYFGRVANDSYGIHYSKDMQTCGVGFPGPVEGIEGTGTSVILVTPDSQRTMLTHLGVSATLKINDVDEKIVNASKMAYIEGYLWTEDESRAAAQKVSTLAKNIGIPIAFTLSDSFIASGFKKNLIDFIRQHVDILFCNEIEAKTLTDQKDVNTAFMQLQNMVGTLFVTLGAKGSCSVDIKGTRTWTKAFPLEAVDTTGAGDLFAAGAIYGLLNNFSLENCSILASYCASQVISNLGARMPVNAYTDVNQILKSYEDFSSA